MITLLFTRTNFLPKVKMIADKKGLPLRHYIVYYLKIKTNN